MFILMFIRLFIVLLQIRNSKYITNLTASETSAHILLIHALSPKVTFQTSTVQTYNCYEINTTRVDNTIPINNIN
jgi:hypothetical protein